MKLQGQTRTPVNVPSPAQVHARARLTMARKLQRHLELQALVAAIRARSAS